MVKLWHRLDFDPAKNTPPQICKYFGEDGPQQNGIELYLKRFRPSLVLHHECPRAHLDTVIISY